MKVDTSLLEPVPVLLGTLSPLDCFSLAGHDTKNVYVRTDNFEMRGREKRLNCLLLYSDDAPEMAGVLTDFAEDEPVSRVTATLYLGAE